MPSNMVPSPTLSIAWPNLVALWFFEMLLLSENLGSPDGGSCLRICEICEMVSSVPLWALMGISCSLTWKTSLAAIHDVKLLDTLFTIKISEIYSK